MANVTGGNYQGINNYRTLQEIVVDRLRDWIKEGVLKPRDKLSQDDLAAKLGVSRMPLREAFRQLEAEGLVTVYPHKGVYVTALSPDEIQELHMIRTVLEGLAARLAAEKMTAETLAKLEAILAQMHQVAEEGQTEELLELDREFHGTMYRASKCEHLCDLIHRLRDKSDPYIKAYMTRVGRAKESLAEHRGIINACAARDSDLTERLVKENLERTAGAVIRILREEHSELNLPSRGEGNE